MKVNIGVVAGDAGSLHGVGLMLLREFLEGVVIRLRDQVTLLDPAFDAVVGPYFYEAAIMIEYLNAVTGFHDASLGVDGGNPVAEKGLRSGDVSEFLIFAAGSTTRQKRGEQQ